jgi:hypothetical protein
MNWIRVSQLSSLFPMTTPIHNFPPCVRAGQCHFMQYEYVLITTLRQMCQRIYLNQELKKSHCVGI